MRASVPALALFACGLVASSACELTAKVGDLRPVADDSGSSSTLPPQTSPDGGAATELTWRLHAPIIPCTIHAMAEVRADELYLGCNGGRIYRFDGVSAELVHEVEDTRVFSLLWVAPNGQVWAAAQSAYGPDARTQLYRFDGKVWTKIGEDGERLTALTGIDTTNVWAATAKEIRHFDGTRFTTSYTASAGDLRACTFATANKGWCTGTSGLAVVWDGQSWSSVTNAPWSAQAEVLGVELSSSDKLPIFFYGEPIDAPHGDWSVRATKWTGTTFTGYSASIPTFMSYDMPRTRTGRVNVNGRSYMLLALDEQYGHALLFDSYEDEFRPLCGPILAFSVGSAKTRVGGFDGLLATIVGTGGDQVALATITEAFEFSDLSMAEDGATWARIEDRTVCGSTADRLVRFDEARWRDVSAPQPATSGRGLAALSRDRAYTLAVPDEMLAEYGSGAWEDRVSIPNASALSAKRRDDVWLGSDKDELAHWDGTALRVLAPEQRRRQILQVVSDGSTNVWMVAIGYTQDDSGVHVYRWADGKRTEWDLGLRRLNVRIATLDATHAWMSGAPAKAWDGSKWTDLPFDASGVWARTSDEVYFTRDGDIFRWDGVRLERVYHGFIPILFIDGSKDRGIAVGRGGLTVELAAWPKSMK
jgi:hypothetical protein